MHRVNPYGEHFYDGISLHPFEVMFVKVKEKVLVNDWEFAVLAKKYEDWMTQQVCEQGVVGTTYDPPVCGDNCTAHRATHITG